MWGGLGRPSMSSGLGVVDRGVGGRLVGYASIRIRGGTLDGACRAAVKDRAVRPEDRRADLAGRMIDPHAVVVNDVLCPFVSVAGSLTGVFPASAHRVRDGSAIGDEPLRKRIIRHVHRQDRSVRQQGKAFLGEDIILGEAGDVGPGQGLRIELGHSRAKLLPSNRCPLGRSAHGESPMKSQSGPKGGATIVQGSAFGS